MKRFILILIWFIFGLSSQGAADEIIRVATGEWKPYISKGLKHYGVCTHIVTEAFALEGVKVEIGFFPWPRAEHYAQTGEWDAMATLVSTPERKKVFNLSSVAYSSKRVFFYLKSYSFDWDTIDDLKDIDIGATIGYKYGSMFENAEKEGKISVQRVPKDVQNFQKMLIGRIKIFPYTIEAGYFMLREQFSSDQAVKITHHPKILQKADYHVMFPKSSKRSQRLVELFNKGLKQLKKSGRYDQMFKESRNGGYVVKK
ncbi:MAG: amino acid ABC transporter substrate-binding protein [Desulfobacteraceae bacterium]|nr:amino acid ABC transporter substrate-binding protein [Desulfobacteraceae bacterium]